MRPAAKNKKPAAKNKKPAAKNKKPAAKKPVGNDPRVNRCLLGDCVQLLQTLPANSVDMILSDIPYGIGLDDWDVLHNNTNSAYGGSSPAQAQNSAFKKRGKPINGWSEADRQIPREYYEWCMTWAPEWYRVLKPGGSAFVFAGRRFMHRAVCALEDSGFNLRDILGWNKGKALHRAQRLSIIFERRSNMEAAQEWDGWRVGNLKPSFEPIIWVFKPYKTTIADNVLEHCLGAYNYDRLNELVQTQDNFFNISGNKNDSGLHPAQKPENLMKLLIELVTQPGQTVLDPFAGSGTTGTAAISLNRVSLMIERDPEIFEVMQRRLSEVQTEL